MLTAGQVHDVHGGRGLLARVPPMRRLIADKAYDANDLRAFLASQGTEAVISPMPRRLGRRRSMPSPIAVEISSSVPFASSRTGVQSPPATTRRPAISSQASASP